ncbi:DUF3263 domain-containing protein [Changpingibacter yushuensis]|uniref:DUF3263 domain-containing protein n=1 Tax=Changpingibacter yushuensis TaxID=2758440 RepID=UPI00165EA8F4|nr:DUF3263 domain-containing protein [Changpingibacter yushuensis]
MPLVPLTDEERATLDFETTWHGNAHRKQETLTARGWTTTHYYLVLGRALAKPVAALEYPETVRRLTHLRQIRNNERHANRPVTR